MSDPAAIRVLLDLGVPPAAALEALSAIDKGQPTGEAFEVCAAALPDLDVALLARAEALVLRSEVAVRERHHVHVRRKETAMVDDDSGYELTDPKHPTYHDRMAGAADDRRKRERENPVQPLPRPQEPDELRRRLNVRFDETLQCGHDGWVAGCVYCEEQEQIAREAMGDR